MKHCELTAYLASYVALFVVTRRVRPASTAVHRSDDLASAEITVLSLIDFPRFHSIQREIT